VTDGHPIDERTVAYHEAGHAVQYCVEGCDVEFIELTLGGKNHGSVKPRSASSATLTSPQHLRISLAGIAAEFVAKPIMVPSNADELFDIVDEVEGWESDWERAHYYALEVVGEGKYETADNLRFRQFLDVVDVQTLHQATVARVADHLLKERRLSGDTLKSLIAT
jgi:hypothetical protein